MCTLGSLLLAYQSQMVSAQQNKYTHCSLLQVSCSCQKVQTPRSKNGTLCMSLGLATQQCACCTDQPRP
jgi:hypothetical protein